MSRLLLFFLVLCAPLTAPAQAVTAADSLWFKTTALAGYRQWIDGSLPAPTTWFLDSAVVSAWYDTMPHFRQPVPRPRDSAEVATLTTALHAEVLRPSRVACERWICTVDGKTPDPPARLIAIGEPRVDGDSATVMFNRRPLETLGRNEIVGGRTATMYAAFFVRRDGQWKMTCLAVVATDVQLTYRQATDRCWTPPES